MGKRLYVGNLSFNTTEEEVRALFAEAGNVTSVSLVTDRDTGRSRGFAFVEMATDEEATKAREAVNGRTVGNRALVVNEARPMNERHGGGGGRGGERRGGGGFSRR
jgi:RNA recognition motif-containing protein